MSPSSKRSQRKTPVGSLQHWLGPTAAPDELVLFIFVNALDVFMTYWMLAHGGFTESNPIALYFIHRWGIRGMVYFKFSVVAFVSLIAHIVGIYNPQLAVRFLRLGIVIVIAVVIYSFALYLRHNGGSLPAI